MKPGSLFATVTALAMSATAQEVVSESTSYQSGGRRIGVSVFKPETTETLSSIIVLHGAGGVDAGNAYVRQLATAVAGAGYATYLIEYFDRTGTDYADDRTIRANADKWLSTLMDGVNFVATQRGADPERIGVFGYSLGGYLAVALAAREPRVRAVVELAGGIEPELAREVKRLPPTLIVHGEQDTRVPFARATELKRVLENLGTQVETEFLPNERHILTPMAAFHALARALEFFGKHLRAK